MIVLDANVIIGFLDANDPHHSRTLRILEDSIAEGYGASVLTVAEALIQPTKHGLHDAASTALNEIGLVVLPLNSEDALALARVRAQYQVRMPAAVALHAALATKSRLATFDTGLAAAAHKAGISTVGIQ
jgi:predicted nucleic acid-binding protein